VSGTTNDQLYDAFGAYVRSQRQLAQLTLRQAAHLARISNPYLSQIEHGLALPSIAVLSALADALSVSAETMLLRAAGLVPLGQARSPHQTEESIRQDPRLDNSQKHALLAVLASFVGSTPAEPVVSAVSAGPAVADESAARDESAVRDESVVRGESARVVTRRSTPTRTPARPAAAGRAASHRRKGV
jgi:transcriptional regulator with XRE-family HTH domain